MLHRNILNTNFQNCLFSSFFSQVDGNAPTFVTKPTIRQDADGSTLIFHCSIFADPKPVVSWFHNGDKIQDNNKFQVRDQYVKGEFLKEPQQEKNQLAVQGI